MWGSQALNSGAWHCAPRQPRPCRLPPCRWQRSLHVPASLHGQGAQQFRPRKDLPTITGSVTGVCDLDQKILPHGLLSCRWRPQLRPMLVREHAWPCTRRVSLCMSTRHAGGSHALPRCRWGPQRRSNVEAMTLHGQARGRVKQHVSAKGMWVWWLPRRRWRPQLLARICEPEQPGARRASLHVGVRHGGGFGALPPWRLQQRSCLPACLWCNPT